MSLPNPGSDDARSQGCTCPVMDNCRGAGIPTSTGVCFYYASDCPMHGAGLPDGREPLTHQSGKADQ